MRRSVRETRDEFRARRGDFEVARREADRAQQRVIGLLGAGWKIRVVTPIAEQWMGEQPVVIEDGAWLGHGTVVLPGSHIGRQSVIGANSVVMGEIPAHSVAVGAPARVVRRYEPDRGWTRAGVDLRAVPDDTAPESDVTSQSG